MQLKEAQIIAAKRIAEAGSDSAAADARILLMHVTGLDRLRLITEGDRELPAEQEREFMHLVAEREQGHPIAHLIGHREFWTLDLKVTKDTLIPRPDTETLVEQALKFCAENEVKSVLDLGTGTGAVILSIKSERPDLFCCAGDISEGALKTAAFNAENNKLDVTFLQGSWFEALKTGKGQIPAAFDLIVSNPPYIEENDPHLSRGDVRFEPLGALVSGRDGLEDIRKIIADAPLFLNKGGCLLLEHGYNQAEDVRELLSAGGFSHPFTVKDLGGNDRVSGAVL